jgi:acetyl esterase
VPDAAKPDVSFAALLADPRAALRRLPPHVPLGVLREGANAFMAAAPGPAIHAIEDLTLGGVGVRLYRPSAGLLPVILFAHGGGFMLGSLDTHDALCRALALHSGAAVIAVDYRLAPEACFPAPLDDITAVHAALVAASPARLDPNRLAIAGDSAGGQLAAAAALSLPVRHVGLFYPLLDPACASASHAALAEGYVLTGSFVGWAWETYRGAARDNDPRFNLTTAAVAGHPPATIVTAAFDPLRDEGEAFGARLAFTGVDVVVERFAGMIHGFAGMPQLTPAADAAIALVGRRIGATLGSVE